MINKRLMKLDWIDGFADFGFSYTQITINNNCLKRIVERNTNMSNYRCKVNKNMLPGSNFNFF